jgi:hypothetical protein
LEAAEERYSQLRSKIPAQAKREVWHRYPDSGNLIHAFAIYYLKESPRILR